MITAYENTGGKIAAINAEKTVPKNAAWVDLLNPTDEERAFISKALGIHLPTAADIRSIEASSRLYSEGDAVYLTLDVLSASAMPDPVLDALLIVVTPKTMVTMRFCEPRSVENFVARLGQQPALLATPQDGLLGLLDAITDRMADILEIIGKDSDLISTQIFRRGSPGQKEKRLEEILQSLGRLGGSTQKIRDSISGMARLLTFLEPRIMPGLTPEQMAKFQALDRDVNSLTEHAQFAAQETSFLLDAALGQINIEQNNIIKFLSIVMVVFTPPTFFASMWGMNFHDMPEYAWSWGYPMAWLVMVVSAVLPLIYFRRRGWF